MRIVKPATLAVLPKPFRYRQQQHLAVSAIGFFALGGAAVCRFMPEQLQWPAVMAALPPGEVPDFAMPKAHGEMLLAATACAPSDRPVTRMQVRATLGNIDKSLLVIGEREWCYGLVPLYHMSDPQPFTQMPITYARAFGGPRLVANPVGAGYLGRRLPALFGPRRGTAWNIEHPDDPVTSPHARCAPAGFGPLDIRSPARRAKAGSYGRRWLRRDFPGLPDDVDWSLFNAAPEDQQQDGFFAGGEPYRLEGLHPRTPVIEGQLPRLRVRAFVHRRGTTADEAEEVALVCDTVWFFPSQDMGAMIYRGQTSIHDSDALDVESMLVVYEAADAAPRSLQHYRHALRVRADPATAALYALDETPLVPVAADEERAARARRREQAATEELAKQQALLDEMQAEFWSRSGLQPPPGLVRPTIDPPPLPPITPQAVLDGDVDLADMMTRAERWAAEMRQQSEAKLQTLSHQLEPPPLATSAAIAQQLAAALSRASRVAADLVDAAIAATAPELQHVDPASLQDDALRARFEAAAASLPALQRRTRRASPQPLFPSQPLFDCVRQGLGSSVREWHARGVCLAGRDLAGADLSKAAFAAADLREVMLERADLSHADLHGANLQGAVLTGARLANANFAGADLSRANISLANAAGACFRDARLEGTVFTDADCSGADFSAANLANVVALRTRLDGAVLLRSNLSAALLHDVAADGASFASARLERAVLLGARLRGAVFDDASLERTVLLNVHAEDSSWRGARLVRVQVGGASVLLRADFSDAAASQCGLRGADLREADLSRARFTVCDFGTCRLDGACLDGALLWRSIFTQASLRGCSLQETDFFQALCRKADFRGSSLRAAKLKQADLWEVAA